MFTPIDEYMLKSREERRAHLKLDEACVLIGGYDSREYRGLLAHVLGTTIPTGNRAIALCHACNVGGCSNPNHLYWGTRKDNHIDAVEAGIYQSQFARAQAKYGNDAYREILVAAARKGGSAPRKKSVPQ